MYVFQRSYIHWSFSLRCRQRPLVGLGRLPVGRGEDVSVGADGTGRTRYGIALE